MAIEDNGTQIQAAYGGYILGTPATDVKETLVYSEPGFTTPDAIEFAIPKADQFYFIIRKRIDEYGTSFQTINRNNFIVNVTDATLNIPLDAIVENFSSASPYYDSNWDSDGLNDNQKLILVVESGVPVDSPVNRVRIIDCKITDRTDDSVLFFRVLVDDFNKVFHFLSVRSNEVGNRNEFSTAGSTVSRDVDGKGDFYVLISPFASFNEVSKGSHAFAYPLNSIFYKRQNTYNQEDFTYQITRFSHNQLKDSVRVRNVPGYPQMGVVIADRGLYNDIEGIGSTTFVDVEARGLVSEMRDTFRITFVRI